MNKKPIVTFTASLLAAACVTGCAVNTQAGNSNASEVSDEAEPAIEENKAVESEKAEIVDQFDDAESGDADVFEEYKPTGEDPFLQPIYVYFRDNIKDHYAPADVFLPEFDIFREDDSDPDDVKVWGDFHVSNYNVRGTTFMCMSGGAYPGCFHLEKDGNEFTVKSADFVEDGSNYSESLKKIFSDDELMAAFQASDDDERDVRSNVIHEYAIANGLKIRAYQDYGWEPVQVDMDDDSFAEDAQCPDVAGNWKSDNEMTMTVEAPENSFTYSFKITGADSSYDIYATYEMQTKTFWYWDCFENEEQALGEGQIVVNDDGSMTWIRDGKETSFVQTE